ncbi:hypothetical protein D9757_007516 [Collybiopsis confluens]|uniref:Uncharacterized protein n=1 Tax=Collybiopsis confluens TaxID=2823264 RepID=A0A8H5M8G9_9AGAR|nr:hypothetical protein D9757_007516 [Collybiopsis confluens]
MTITREKRSIHTWARAAGSCSDTLKYPGRMPSTLVISRADETDIDGILGLIYSAFKGNDLREAFFGHDTPESRASAKERIAASMRTGQQNVWLKVVEQETGRMVSGSWWMVYPNLDSSENLSESAAAKRNVDYLYGEDKVKGELFVRDWMTRRARYMYGHAHIC